MIYKKVMTISPYLIIKHLLKVACSFGETHIGLSHATYSTKSLISGFSIKLYPNIFSVVIIVLLGKRSYNDFLG